MSGSVVAIVPARGGSSSIPLKNLREIDGRKLVQIAAEHGLAADPIDHVIVNSDHAEIRAAGAAVGAETMDRPDRFAHHTTMMEVDRLLQWCVRRLEDEGREISVVVLLYSTAPLRTVETVEKAVEMVTEDSYDSVLSLQEEDDYLWEADGDVVRPKNYDPTRRGPRQNEDWNQWVENLAVYAVDRDVLLETGCRLGGTTGYVEMPNWRSVDIDDPEDLQIARVLWHNPIDERELEEPPVEVDSS